MLEILAGRLLAPYIGVSLYTWTSIIGVILAGVSLGNWAGGVWSDRGANERSVAIVLTLSGTTCLAVLLTLTLLAPWLETMQLSALGASFIYVCALFFVPSFFIGIITPVLTTLALQRRTRTGHVVGMMNALSAAGSIIGTFLAGYWLIQYFGTHNLIIACAIACYLLAIPFYIGHLRIADTAILMLTLLIIMLTYQRNGYSSPCDRESQYFCIRIVNASDMVPHGFANAMVLDNLLHGVNHETRPDMLVYPYVHAIDEIVHKHFDSKVEKLDYFFAGGGSYTHPRAISSLYPEARVTVSELDPAVTQMATDHMNVTTDSIEIIHQDARRVLQQYKQQRFDVIVGDVFHDITLPFHLVTREYAQLIKSRLEQNGIYIMNIVDSEIDPLLVKSIYKTLLTEFRYVNIWTGGDTSKTLRQTYILSASHGHDLPNKIDATHGFQRSWQKANNRILENGKPLERLPLLSDNYVPVDRLISTLIFEKKPTETF
jgi:hypothetical protein